MKFFRPDTPFFCKTAGNRHACRTDTDRNMVCDRQIGQYRMRSLCQNRAVLRQIDQPRNDDVPGSFEIRNPIGIKRCAEIVSYAKSRDFHQDRFRVFPGFVCFKIRFKVNHRADVACIAPDDQPRQFHTVILHNFPKADIDSPERFRQISADLSGYEIGKFIKFHVLSHLFSFSPMRP